MIRAAPTGMWVPRLAGGLEYAILGPPEAAPVVDGLFQARGNRILWGEQGGSRAMQPPFQAYRGDEPYIFVSYAHADKALVYPEIKALHERGCRIWYDEGMRPAHSWSEEIAHAIGGCAFFIVFMTPDAAKSQYVRKEIEFAVDERKEYLVKSLPPDIYFHNKRHRVWLVIR
jgi:hypothetical protein